ncbi:MAG: Crp/Fnr family transcriptional regulator [Bacteroidales bacterium]|jgi:CRP-like cAMP-binding protein|nr:Crp/Fnr family transcriptional regulator [Bacteroidales bacterium]
MDYRILEGSPLLKGMNAGEIEAVLGRTNFRMRRFTAGTMIAGSGDPVTSLCLVVSGTVKGEMVDYAGRVIKIEDIPAPGALAAAFIFGSKNRFPVNVMALSDGDLLVIEKPDFLSVLEADERLLVNFLNMISNRSQFLSEKIKFLNFKTIKGKLAYFILQKAEAGGDMINTGMTQTDLAEFFGVTRPSIARALGDMEEAGYISAKGRIIRIIDRTALTTLTSDL